VLTNGNLVIVMQKSGYGGDQVLEDSCACTIASDELLYASAVDQSPPSIWSFFCY